MSSGAFKFSSYPVPQPFTFYRLLLVEILVEVITYSPADSLDALPLEAWDLFVPWFFQYRYISPSLSHALNLFQELFHRKQYLTSQTFQCVFCPLLVDSLLSA
jgi:hypothetical protein